VPGASFRADAGQFQRKERKFFDRPSAAAVAVAVADNNNNDIGLAGFKFGIECQGDDDFIIISGRRPGRAKTGDRRQRRRLVALRA
jgi:hypothetical protein